MARFDPHPARRPAIVAGASSGIGAATAIELAAHGFPVALGARRVEKCQELAAKIIADGGELRVTVARWYTPDNHTIQDEGITPDIEVPFDVDAALEGVDNQLETAIAVLNGTYEPNTVLEREAMGPALP